MRKGKDHDADALHITPFQVIVSGLIGTALFVLVLLFIVHQVTH